MKPTKYIWHNGEFVNWDEATVHISAHALHYGSSIFEGIRCYETPSGSAIFRLDAHMRRLYDSAKLYRMEIPFTFEQMSQACRDVITRNDLTNAYIRPIALFGSGTLAVNPLECQVETAVIAFPWGAYLGQDGLEKGIDVCITSWQRTTSASIPVLAKAGGHYLNAQLVASEAHRNGFVEGITVSAGGMLSEGSGENLFLVRDGVIYTPPISAAILGGITRDTVMTIADHLGYEVRQETLPRELLYLADEAFFSGTAAEVTPIRSVDKSLIGSGSPGEITRAIQNVFFGLFDGRQEDIWSWLEPVAVKAESI